MGAAALCVAGPANRGKILIPIPAVQLAASIGGPTLLLPCNLNIQQICSLDRLLCCKGTDHSLRYLAVHDNRYLRYFQGHTARVTALCMSPKSDAFISTAQARAAQRPA